EHSALFEHARDGTSQRGLFRSIVVGSVPQVDGYLLVDEVAGLLVCVLLLEGRCRHVLEERGNHRVQRLTDTAVDLVDDPLTIDRRGTRLAYLLVVERFGVLVQYE